MEIRIEINQINRNSVVNWQSLNISKALTSQVDTASFQILKIKDGYIPEVADEVEIYSNDGTETKIFGGYITKISENLEIVDGGYYSINCQDYSYKLSGVLAVKSYVDKTGKEIIDDLIAQFAPGFSTNNVICESVISKIVFNQAPVTECLTRISKIIGFEWFVDADKDIHFFQRFSLVAPFTLTDTNGNYVYKSLKRNIDGSQIANQVKVRGGMGTESNRFEDTITVKGGNTLTFKLPYKFSELKVYLNDVEKTVGVDNIDNFPDKDVLYNYQADSIRFASNRTDGDKIRFSGFKKYPVMAIVSDDASIALIGLREKMIDDKTLEDATTARERAFLELELSNDSVTDCAFNTYQNGLEVGMRINISSELRALSGLDYLISSIILKARGPFDFYYSVSCSTARKMGLTEFLKELSMRGDIFEEDDSVVSEIIKTDISSFEITEEIEAIGAKDVIEKLQVEELIQDSTVEPIWVLGDYTPTSIDDPKRMGRLGLSMKLY